MSTASATRRGDVAVSESMVLVGWDAADGLWVPELEGIVAFVTGLDRKLASWERPAKTWRSARSDDPLAEASSQIRVTRMQLGSPLLALMGISGPFAVPLALGLAASGPLIYARWAAVREQADARRAAFRAASARSRSEEVEHEIARAAAELVREQHAIVTEQLAEARARATSGGLEASEIISEIESRLPPALPVTQMPPLFAIRAVTPEEAESPGRLQDLLTDIDWED